MSSQPSPVSQARNPSLWISNVAATSAACLLFTTAAIAQDNVMQTTGSPVVVLTKISTPWYAPRVLVISKFRETVPDYDNLPGLDYKYYTLSADDKFGGLYLWKDYATAKAWFNDAWMDKIIKSRGSPAEVRMFEAPVLVDNVPSGTTPGADGKAVTTIVSLKIPTGVTHDQIVSGFKKSVPLYRAVPGLLRKYFTIGEDGRFGGVYLWKDKESANSFYSATWHSRIQSTYGVAAEVEYFDAPVILPSRQPRPKEISDHFVTAEAPKTVDLGAKP